MQLQFIISRIFTTSHRRICISTTIKSCENPTHAVSRLTMVQCDKINITVVSSYTGKNIAHFVAIGIVIHAAHSYQYRRRRLVIISGIALYYGDTYI